MVSHRNEASASQQKNETMANPLVIRRSKNPATRKEWVSTWAEADQMKTEEEAKGNRVRLYEGRGEITVAIWEK